MADSSSKNQVVDYYNDIAKKYDDDRFNNTYGRFIDAEERHWLQLLGAGTERFGNALEIACGTGRLTEFAAVGLDGSKEMLSVAKEKFQDKQLIEADARNIPLEDGSFDTIYSFHLMMHLQLEDIESIMNEAYRLLKPGGRLIFDIPSKKRRQLIHGEKTDNWHGATSMNVQMLRDMAGEKFTLNNTFGILFMPIHKIPKRVRLSLLGLDKWFCSGCMKEYSSYLLAEFIRK